MADKKKQNILVVAGSKKQFDYWLKTRDDKKELNFVYCSSIAVAREREYVNVLYVEEYYKSDVLKGILSEDLTALALNKIPRFTDNINLDIELNAGYELKFTNKKEDLPKSGENVLCIVKRISLDESKFARYEKHVGHMMTTSRSKNPIWIVGGRFDFEMGEVVAWAYFTSKKVKE